MSPSVFLCLDVLSLKETSTRTSITSLFRRGSTSKQLFAGQVDGIATVGAQHRDYGGVGRSFQPTDKVAFVFPDPAEQFIFKVSEVEQQDVVLEPGTDTNCFDLGGVAGKKSYAFGI